jgi:hypothetical protein
VHEFQSTEKMLLTYVCVRVCVCVCIYIYIYIYIYETGETKLFQRLTMEFIRIKVGKDKKSRNVPHTYAVLLDYSCYNSKT